MKKIVLTPLFALCIAFAISAQDNCSKYYPMKEGTSFEYTNYDKKGKVEGVTNYTISSVTAEGSAQKATLDLKISDNKGKEVFTTDYSFTCDDNMVKIDYKSLFPGAMMKQYSDMGMEMDISGSDIELPNDLTVGQDLADANVTINMNMSGMNMKISVDQTNRKVLKEESVTTPAGTFNCILLTENTQSKTMGATILLNSKLWLAEGVGMVKQETYKKNGDLMSTTELTKFSK
ncbi:MAG: hypothetical protein ACFCUL_03870 [Flavobacteriaceae bacterium]